MSAPQPPKEPGMAAALDRERDGQRSYARTHAQYWKSRLEHRTYTREGKTFEVAEWSVRIHFKGVRRSFDLETANKEEAATKARDIYVSLVTKGWSTTLTELTPQTMAPVDANANGANPTVGEFLAEVERTSNLKPKTFRRYAQYFRMLAAQIQGVKSDASRYDYCNGGLTHWREKVDAVPLTAITPAAVADWKIAYLKRAGSDPRRKLEVNRSFNAAIRHCKSLFSSHIINQPNFGVKIPRFKVPDGQRGEREAYWFETVDFERAGSMKFQAPAGVTYEKLVTDARSELRSQHPETYKLFLLCLCAGLRRAEADVCLWTQLNPEDNSIRIEANQFIEPKHGSGGTVYVDPTLMKELLSFKGETQNGFVVNSTLKWKPTSYGRYRCEPHWKTLIDWLEGNGISARKKVHELRKLFGDAIVKRNGIFAGSAQLRHSTIQMTASHYTDPRQRAALPVANLFPDEGTQIVPSPQPEAELPAQRPGTNDLKVGIKRGV
ncbi:MAG: site-specific integrase [Verrucomicrobia bacterium]|nr:site-specific integrase [Verrucomicrobiota bacterium]